ncbi:hypothetical protein [Bacillus toyonensis]|uniref:hypothetical protein n=1 Tax=Bacillus toyonensis TaxID=155322 RepID=UPI000BF5FE3B|nr:hypothetical protein [Bacillus toyonensis]PGF05063.1 hypothetical protein COM61_01115 [Bacillus toyonensis]
MGELKLAENIKGEVINFGDFAAELKDKENKHIVVHKLMEDYDKEVYTDGELLHVKEGKGGSFTLIVDEEHAPSERTYFSFLINEIRKNKTKYYMVFKQGYVLEFAFKKSGSPSIKREVKVATKPKSNKEEAELRHTLNNLGFTETKSFKHFSNFLMKSRENGYTDILTINAKGKKLEGLLDSVTVVNDGILLNVYQLGKGLGAVKFLEQDIILVTEIKFEDLVYFTVYGKSIVSPVIVKTK